MAYRRVADDHLIFDPSSDQEREGTFICVVTDPLLTSSPSPSLSSVIAASRATCDDAANLEPSIDWRRIGRGGIISIH